MYRVSSVCRCPVGVALSTDHTVLRELRGNSPFCDKPWVSVFTSKEATAPCGRLVMLLDHVFTRDVTVSTSTRIERKVAMTDVWPRPEYVEIWQQLPAPGLSEETLGADVVYGQRRSSDPL